MSTEGALDHAEETSKLYKETTVKIKPGGGLRAKWVDVS